MTIEGNFNRLKLDHPILRIVSSPREKASNSGGSSLCRLTISIKSLPPVRTHRMPTGATALATLHAPRPTTNRRRGGSLRTGRPRKCFGGVTPLAVQNATMGSLHPIRQHHSLTSDGGTTNGLLATRQTVVNPRVNRKTQAKRFVVRNFPSRSRLRVTLSGTQTRCFIIHARGSRLRTHVGTTTTTFTLTRGVAVADPAAGVLWLPSIVQFIIHADPTLVSWK
ncbi:hypothetical protein RBWH47_03362 [Rhodopirellula baltica WH47]|uniref:Uncharacterized protein n=1 Tax=Rhodopirellula baltica WH47 TaxID=991778 RepID=F2APZ4_RHOBT|nr:hypothetical protein RBWH47_03362 [Rhodopirellula baltica WH47]